MSIAVQRTYSSHAILSNEIMFITFITATYKCLYIVNVRAMGKMSAILRKSGIYACQKRPDFPVARPRRGRIVSFSSSSWQQSVARAHACTCIMEHLLT